MTHRAFSRSTAIAAVTIILLMFSSCTTTQPQPTWTELFDGHTLEGWSKTLFGGEGEISIVDGAIDLQSGSPLTGVTLQTSPPSGNYELEVVASRVEGTDFFCGLTFPVGESHLTLVLGGWGGSVCGFSSIDNADASRNLTRKLKGFTLGRDYKITVRVTKDEVLALLDDEPFVATKRAGVTFSLRPEVMLCKPLGIASFSTIANVKSVRWHPLAASE